jgi:RNA polymerase sigma-B factor
MPPSRSRRDRALLERYRVRGDVSARDALIADSMPLVRTIAREYVSTDGEPLEDLVQVGSIGLLNAIEHFDLESDFRFVAFASVHVRGEIRKHFRDKTWSIHVPRGLQELEAKVRRGRGQLESQLGRRPSLDELADHVGLSGDEVREADQVGAAYRSLSLDAPSGGGDEPQPLMDAVPQADDAYGRADDRLLLGELLRGLSERDRNIVWWRYVDGDIQSDIAARLGVSQMQVSRLLRRIGRRLEAIRRLHPEPGESAIGFDEFREAMDALEDHVTVVDGEGRLVHVNAAWRAFAKRNRWKGLQWEGMDYLSVCDAGDDDAQAVADGLRAVLRGDERTFSIEYPCHAPDELRWFSLRVTSLPVEGERGAVLNHRDITAQRLARDAQGAPRRHLLAGGQASGALDRDGLAARAEQLVALDREVGVLVLLLPRQASAADRALCRRETLAVLEQLFLPPSVTGGLRGDELLVLLPGVLDDDLQRAAGRAAAALRTRLDTRLVDRIVFGTSVLRTDLEAAEALGQAVVDMRPCAAAGADATLDGPDAVVA